MENTLENKVKFFALYWGQNILISKVSDGSVRSKVLGRYFEGELREAFLELKPLSSISDEDAIEVSKLCVNGNNKRIDDIKVYARIYASQSSLINDFLRSRGYALPWMGLSVEELVQRGWIKLKEGIE